MPDRLASPPATAPRHSLAPVGTVLDTSNLTTGFGGKYLDSTGASVVFHTDPSALRAFYRVIPVSKFNLTLTFRRGHMRPVLSSTVLLLCVAAIGSTRAQAPAKLDALSAPAATFSLASAKPSDTAAALHSSAYFAYRDRETSSRSIEAGSRRKHVRHDAIVGGSIGAALGIIGGSLVHVGCDVSGSSCSARRTRASAIVTSAVIMGAIGAGIGALVGLVRSAQ